MDTKDSDFNFFEFDYKNFQDPVCNLNRNTEQ